MLPLALVASIVLSFLPISFVNAANVMQKTPPQFFSQSKTSQHSQQKTQEASHPELSSFNGIHIVKDGETLFGIARLYGVSYSSLLENNSINADGSIRVGQKINVPKTVIGTASVQNLAKNEQQTPVIVPVKDIPSNGLHIVTYGETIFGIARSYGVSPIDFATENEFELSHIIKIGDKLKIPKKTDSVFSQPQTVSQPVVAQKIETKPFVATPAKEISKTPVVIKASELQVGAKVCELDILWPIPSKKIVKKYGDILKNGAKNDGAIIESAIGKSVVASYSGEVVYAGNDIAEYGNLMIVKHKDNWMTIYGYMKSFSKKVGDRVIKGDEIGKTGDTGDATSPSLYFSIRKVKTPYNPALCI